MFSRLIYNYKFHIVIYLFFNLSLSQIVQDNSISLYYFILNKYTHNKIRVLVWMRIHVHAHCSLNMYIYNNLYFYFLAFIFWNMIIVNCTELLIFLSCDTNNYLLFLKLFLWYRVWLYKSVVSYRYYQIVLSIIWCPDIRSVYLWSI